MRLSFSLAALAAALFSVSPAVAADPKPLRIGVLNDQSGIYADMAGPGSVIAA